MVVGLLSEMCGGRGWYKFFEIAYGPGLHHLRLCFLDCFIWVCRGRRRWERWMCGKGIRGDVERALFDRELHVITNLENNVNRFTLKAHGKDSWRWSCSTDGRFATSKAYKLISGRPTNSSSSHGAHKKFKWIWNKITPVKASSIVWWLRWDRLPTKFNLLKK